MRLKRALKRIWRDWKFTLIFAVLLYLVVFYIAYNYEAHREEEGESLEEPLSPFKVTVSPAIEKGSETYTVSVRNDQKYIIREITIEFGGTDLVEPDDVDMIYEDTVNAGSEVSYANYVRENAVALDIVLDDSESFPGLNDINLYVMNENSTKLHVSDSSGNHEEVHLNRRDIAKNGYGSYSATVRHENGFRPVSFRLTYRITYGPLVLKRSSREPVRPGETRAFDFYLNIEEDQISDLRCSISSAVELPEGVRLVLDMTFDAEWRMLEGTPGVPEEYADKIPWGPVDLTGTSGAVMYSLTIIAGIVFFLRSRVKIPVRSKYVKKAHCVFSLVTLVLVSAHLSVVLQKDWPWTSPGLLFSQAAFGILVFFTVFSFFDVEIIRAIGKMRWRRIHIVFTVALALLIVLHFGLMGDHLGWLK